MGNSCSGVLEPNSGRTDISEAASLVEIDHKG
jgi:hypothetical protein